MPRKKRRAIILVAILTVIVAIITTLLILYFTTDMFKSSRTLFAKYIGQNVEGITTAYQRIAKNDYNELLQQNKYTTESKVKINYTKNIGTTSENTENSINQMELQIKGQVDKQNQYNYQDIQLLNKEEKIAKIEYIQDAELYGIRFSDLFKQYLLVRNENLNQILQGDNIPENIDLNDFKNVLKFSEEEKQNLKTKYLAIIDTNIAKESFSKEKDQTIEINNKNVNVNAYTLTLTKEQMNNLYIKMLEELKQDEIILAKMEEMQTVLNKYQLGENTNTREEFAESIEELIAEITKNNIGQEEAKIIVYENYHNTVRTVIQNPQYEITLDVLSLQNENYIQLSYQDIENKAEQIITYKKEESQTTSSIKMTEGRETKQYSLVTNEKIEGNSRNKNMIASYEDSSNRVEATIEQKNDIVTDFENEIQINEENAINFSDLKQEEIQNVMGQVTERLLAEVMDLTTNKINMQDLLEVIQTISIVPNRQNIEGNGVSETERKRYNSKFEILQGNELEGEDVLTLIDAIEENFANMEVVSGTQLRLKLEQFTSNDEVASTLRDFIEENDREKYRAKVEYDENTGLVNAFLLTILEE